MSTIWFVYGMNYAQNSILHDLLEAWCVCDKNSTNHDKPNFSELEPEPETETETEPEPEPKKYNLETFLS